MIPGRKPMLTPDQAAELRARYAIWEANRPTVLANHFGIAVATVSHYARGRQKGLSRAG